MTILEQDDQLHARLTENIEHTQQALRSLGIDAHEHKSAVFAFVMGDLPHMQRIERAMMDRGLLLPLMAYPNGPAPDYFRLVVNASHTHQQIEQFQSIMRDVCAQFSSQNEGARA